MNSVQPSTDFIYPTILPWPEIFEDLRQIGLNPSKIAYMIGKNWSGIQGWVYGTSEPRESDARVIIHLHETYCSDKTQLRCSQASPKYPGDAFSQRPGLPT